jgi:ribosome biogenesis protein ERB1
MAPAKKKQEVDNEEEEESPELSPVDSAGEEEEEESEGGSVYDSDEDGPHYADAGANGDDDDDEEEDGDEDDFEDQGSSDDDDDRLEKQRQEEESDDEDIAISYEKVPRSWKIQVQSKKSSGKRRAAAADGDEKKPAATSDIVAPDAVTKLMHTDDWSSDDDDEEGTGNRIGRVPIHWYDDYDHVGYNVHGSKVAKSASADGASGDRIDQAIAMQDNMAQGKFVVHDALNDTNVELSARQVEIIRRMQASAVAHPEHDANPDYIDYFSGVNPEISGLNSNQYEPKARFQPSRWEKLQVERLLDRLEKGKINMDYLTGKIKDSILPLPKSHHLVMPKATFLPMNISLPKKKRRLGKKWKSRIVHMAC